MARLRPRDPFERHRRLMDGWAAQPFELPEGNFDRGTPPTSVTFAAASASATLSVATEDDEGSGGCEHGDGDGFVGLGLHGE